MAVNKTLYHEWKSHPVTEALKKDLRETLEALVGQMVTRIDPDPHRDSFTRAFARATDAILSWEPEFTTEEQDAAN